MEVLNVALCMTCSLLMLVEDARGDHLEAAFKKCMAYRVEGRRPVGRPRKTWLESVEADMAELEIDKEDVHDRSKWRRNVNVMKRKYNPIGKRTINR